MEPKLPVHGFVLAGGRSTRMGEDKALMPFCGRSMIEIAVEKLGGFCAEVGIAGNRDDLAGYAAVAHEARLNAGPAAGVEAGLMAAGQSWVLFVPVDVPLVPMELLLTWFQAVAEKLKSECAVSYLAVNGQRQPAFCAMRRECLPWLTAALERGERRLAQILADIGENGAGELWSCDAVQLAEAVSQAGPPAPEEIEFWFANVNTPEERIKAEMWASNCGGTSLPSTHHKGNRYE